MRHSQSERMEIIQLVENSELSIRRTLKELGVPRSTFSQKTLGRRMIGIGDIRKMVMTDWQTSAQVRVSSGTGSLKASKVRLSNWP